MLKRASIDKDDPAARQAGAVKVVIEAPDGRLHGHGEIVAAADAYRVRPQDCAPILRHLLFGQRRC